MKRSRYTFTLDCGGGEHVVYNSATGLLAILDEDEFADFSAGKGDCASRMFEQGFLTDLEPAEEAAAQRALFEAQRHDHSELSLVLAPTYACNLRCPYCYELGHNSIKGKMSEEVVAAICDFVEERWLAHAFKRLSVQWYGGDPSLALDVVEDLSAKLIAICEDRGADYDAMMLTNCNVIDEDAVEMLVRSKVSRVFITIDGFEDTHNVRRTSAVGLNSFERNVEAARLFVKHGIAVSANMNVDRVNWPEYAPLRRYLKEDVGIDLNCARLCDYGGFFGTRGFQKPAFDLFGHDEFCKLAHDEFAAGDFGAEDVEALLRPAPRFCKGQKDDYFIIDTLGDIYLCDGYIGEQDHVVGNVVARDYQDALERVSHDPHEDEKCRECKLLPLCQGNCDWERRASGMACHPLLTTLPDYLRDWHAAMRRW